MPSKEEILDWVNQEAKINGFSRFSRLEPLRIEASKRVYFRVLNNNQSLIVNYLEPNESDNNKFAKLSKIFIKHGISVPEVFSCDPKKGFLLQEDFGDRIYQFDLTSSNFDSLIKSAIHELILIQKVPKDTDLFPYFDKSRAVLEMQLFNEWFLKGLLSINLKSVSNKEAWDYTKLLEAYEEVWNNIDKQEETVCHFDFETRNIINKDGAAGIIDFQDSIVGPVSLDLVSLLKDLYYPLSIEQRNKYIEFYFNEALNKNILDGITFEEFQEWFEWSGIQRQLRILGTLSRLYLRDKKEHRLLDLEITLDYLIESTKILGKESLTMGPFHVYLKSIKPKLKSFLESFK